jgi:quinoprotein glucose dehydrogenase
MRETGRIGAGGPIVTRSGLTFIGAVDDGRIRAFETRTGVELWAAQLPGDNYGTPMTYRGADGKQYIAVVATGGFAFSPVTSDELVVYSLP